VADRTPSEHRRPLQRPTRNFHNIEDNVVKRQLASALNSVFERYDPLLSLTQDGARTRRRCRHWPTRPRRSWPRRCRGGVIVRSVTIPSVRFDDNIQQKINQYLAAVRRDADRPAAPEDRRGPEEGQRPAVVGQHTTGVLYQNCLDMVERMVKEGKELPAGFTCGIPPTGGRAGAVRPLAGTARPHCLCGHVGDQSGAALRRRVPRSPPVWSVIDGGRIAGVEAAVPDGLDVVRPRRTWTLLPGLVDAHTHLVFDAGDDAVGRLDTVDDEQLLDGARVAALSALDAGITTVRDLGDRSYVTVRLRDEFASEPGSGPQILAAGPPITTPRGHCWFLGGETRGADGVRAAVRERVERGADVIKVMASGGEITPGSRPWEAQFGLEELRAAVSEAHRHGLPVTAHAHGATGIANVAAAGFDSLEHCSFRTADGAQADPVIIDALVQAGVVISATLGHLPDQPVPPHIAELIPRFSRVFQQVRASGARIICSRTPGSIARSRMTCCPGAWRRWST
jgi:hypothetical protein